MTEEIRECYRLLEAEEGASPEAIKEKYREMVKVWHPDRFPNDPKFQRRATEKTKEINVAYARISANLRGTCLESRASAARTAQEQARRAGESAGSHDESWAWAKQGEGEKRAKETAEQQARETAERQAREQAEAQAWEEARAFRQAQARAEERRRADDRARQEQQEQSQRARTNGGRVVHRGPASEEFAANKRAAFWKKVFVSLFGYSLTLCLLAVWNFYVSPTIFPSSFQSQGIVKLNRSRRKGRSASAV